MRRKRSVSFYADTQEEFIEEMNKKKSISERRRCLSNSHQYNNTSNNDISQNLKYIQKKKYFQSYDDLEIEELGVNSTYQLTKLENQDIEDNEGGLIKKIDNINLSFKEKNNNSFFSNLTPFTKNIIGKFGYKKNKKSESLFKRHQSNPHELMNMFENNLENNKDIEKENEEKNENQGSEEDEYLSGIGHRSYQMRYLGLKNPENDMNKQKRERTNSIIENNVKNEELSFLDNLNINELENINIIHNENNCVNNNHLSRKESSEINNEYNIIEDNDDLELKKENSSNSYDNSGDEFEIKAEKSFEQPQKKDEKKVRKSTFDIKAFIPNSSDNKDERDKNNNQYKALQNFISNNEFLSKNIDYVDEHLKFLITGSDVQTKNIFLSQLFNTKTNNDDNNLESINIIKKVIKLLGDYIKLELYEENCNLCYNHMLQTYVDFSDGIILILNINDTNSAKYIYDIIDRLKYKINKDKRHFNTILFCFSIVQKNIIKDSKEDIHNNGQIEINNETYTIIDKIYNEFDIKPNYITVNMNNNGIKNEKFELVINKFLSLAYLKKERKRKHRDSKKAHKRGMTGL